MTRRARSRWATLAILLHGWLYGCNSTYIAKGNGGAGGGGGADAGSPDADGGKCMAVKVDALPDAGGPACPSDAGCYPGDVTKFSPQQLHPLVAGAPHADVCTPTQISEWYSICGMEGGGNCQAWSSANAKCAACIQTPYTAARHGAVITHESIAGGVYHVNFWGCLAQVEPCNASCAQALQERSECEDTACNPATGACTVHDQASSNAYVDCLAEVELTCGCAGFNGPAVSCNMAILSAPKDHPAVATCGLTDGFEQAYTQVATFLCGH